MPTNTSQGRVEWPIVQSVPLPPAAAAVAESPEEPLVATAASCAPDDEIALTPRR
jgi:hypothetical protein